MILDPPPIPTYWTGEQALEVVDFLQQLIHAIWWVHGNAMTRAAQKLRGECNDNLDDDLDNLPF